MPLFTPHEVDLLTALMSRIIPITEFPSAPERGSVDYLVELLSTDRPELLTVYQQGVHSLDLEAQTVYGLGFLELGAPLQDELLQCIAQGDVRSKWPVDPAYFFSLACDHTAEAYYGDFGNRDGAVVGSWNMVGFDQERARVDHS